MADLGLSWRDRNDGGALRTRYGASRGIDDYITSVDRIYSDRGPRTDFLGVGSDLLRPGLSYEAGLSSGLGLGAGSGLGLDASVGRPGSLGGGSLTSLDITRNTNSREDVLPHDASSTLFVDGLPLDCTRREAAHIFRPFIGYKDLRVLQREGRRSGDKIVLCFVEFADARCAATAMKALQDYKFDDTDKDSYLLRISFARSSGPRGSSRDDDSDRHQRRR